MPLTHQQTLAQAAQVEGVDAEIAVLRVLIRELVAAGDYNPARLAIDALSRIVRSRQASGQPSDRLATWLEQALDDLDAEDPA